MAENTVDNFNIFFQLTKVDQAKRLVYGRATEEKPDSVREIMDYQTSKPNFVKWSDMAKARTSGVEGLPDSAVSLGNIREMHEPVASGKVIAIDFNDSDKAIDIGTYCADDGTWQKILNGVLTGFSIGGTAKRWLDPSNPSYRRYTADPNEISYVDVPCLPTATYKLIKSDGSEELRKFTSPSKADENPTTDYSNTATDDVVKVEEQDEGKPVPTVAGHFVSPNLITDDSNPMSEPVSLTNDAIGVMKAFTDAVNELVAIRKAADQEKTKAEALLKALGSRVGIARREGEPPTRPNDYPTDPNDYGDPANWSWPYDSQERTQSAMAYFNSGVGMNKYSDRERNVLGRRIAARASTLNGVKYQYNPQNKNIERNEVKKMANEDLAKLDLDALVSQLKEAMGIAVDQIGKDPNAARDLLMAALGNTDNSKPATVAAATTSGEDGSPVTMKAATTPTTPATTATTATTAITPSTTPEALKTAAVPSSDTSSTSTPDAYTKMTMDKLDALTAAVTKLVEKIDQPATTTTTTPVQKNIPISDLAALLLQQPQATAEDPILKAIEDGNLAKAAQLAGTKDVPDYGKVLEIARTKAFEEGKDTFTRIMLAQAMGPVFVPSEPQQ